MTRLFVAGCFVIAVLCTSSVNAQFDDNFDTYADGDDLQGVNGWKGWDNSPGASALVSSNQALSAPNSVAINPASDLVNQLDAPNPHPTSGCWEVSVDVYCPAAFTGDQYFIMLNTYNDGLGEKNWSAQVFFGGVGSTTNEGQVADVHDGTEDATGQFPITAPLIVDQWVPLRMTIDLDNNTLQQYYNNAFFRGSSWAGRPGFPAPGTNQLGLSIGAVDLFSAGGADIYYDNFVLQPVGTCPPAQPLSGVEVTQGDYVGGSIADLEFEDTDDYTMRRRNADLQSRTEMIVKSFANPTHGQLDTGETITTLEFTLKGSVFARGNVVQTIELYDYVADAWELLDTRDANRAPMPDSTVTVAATGDLTRFVEGWDDQFVGGEGRPTPLTMCARILYQSDRARQKFASNTDTCSWNVVIGP